jgi:L-threonylcarbamoyladenylate synthase
MRIHRRLFSCIMHHMLISPNREGILRASDLIKSGKLVAFPTETVYGLGANALDADAVKSIFVAKGRPLTDPLIVHVAHQSCSYDLVDLTPLEKTVFDALSKTFWPGPLTLIVKASSKIPMLVTAHTGFVGVRVPKHPLAVALLEASRLPIAAPSANRFGHVSPTTAAHVLADLGERDVHILNGEEGCDNNAVNCEFGIESSVVKIDEGNRQLIIFRQGAVSQAQLEQCLASVRKDTGAGAAASTWKVVAIQRAVKMHSTDNSGPAAASSEETARAEKEQEELAGQQAPGQAITHYAPDVPCVIVRSFRTGPMIRSAAGVSELVAADAAGPGATRSRLDVSTEECRSQCVVVDFGGKLAALREGALAYRDLSAAGSASEAARQLFDALRWAESISGARRVLLAAIPLNTQSGDRSTLSELGADMTPGLADRVFRAASGEVVDLTLYAL